VRAYRFAVRPGWVAFHLLCVVLVVTMVLLGRWQLIVSNQKHFSLQNFGYALQWWAFSIFTVVLWARVVRDRSRRDATGTVVPAEAPQQVQRDVAYRRYVMPSVQSQQPAADPALAAYNDYLARLARQDTPR
jgi:DNA-binding transcriptional regulator of glucitol operon